MSCSAIDRVKHMDEEQPVSQPTRTAMTIYFERSFDLQQTTDEEENKNLSRENELCVCEDRVEA